MKFQYHPEVLARFPQTVGGVILASGLHNQVTPETLRADYLFEQQETLRRIGSTPLSDIPSLAAWRSVFRAFGTDPTKYRSAPEALLRRLTKKGDIPFLNLLVDIGNMVSIRYALPVAVLDVRSVHETITVRFSDGTEGYTELGAEAAEHPEPGEVVFADTVKRVFARRWCWRQSAESTVLLDTTSVIVTVEAQHADGRKDVANALADLLALYIDYAGGLYAHAILDGDTPEITD